ncbi:peptidylprolyl isomerase [Marinicella gelatinilytica]|uniref:peptidylprolyl isomerase n=1 Tax=Marinicella gelatinilytica TaxID=2996017 RepID=UPI002260CACF|nr:peptidylprolyl isomerase [Marinicella gelatinilytica]MCX7545075.1 peptidylprolyl isomerase [Marinicella gelatinilytica]
MKILTMLGLVLLLTACQQDEAMDSTVVDSSRVLLTVDEKPITEQMVRVYLLNKGIQQPEETQINEAVEQLTEQQLLVNYAQKENLQLPLEQALSLQQLQQQTMAMYALKQYLADKTVTDAEIQSEYQRVIAEIKDTEYHVQHLLYKDEVDALSALDELASGTAFLDVQEKYLESHGNMSNVGDIGWVNIKQVPESFAKPLQQLQPGSYYQQPVISQFGAHVIYLADKRKSEPPSFEAVKAGIQRSLEDKKINRFKQLLRAKSDINTNP